MPEQWEARSSDARDWMSPADPRAYQARCWECRELFIGWKRSTFCRACQAAINGEVAAPPAAIQGEAGDTGGHFHLTGASAQAVPGEGS